jgi:PAS domain S-box-containing protein
VSNTSFLKAVPLFSSKQARADAANEANTAYTLLRLFTETTPVAMAVFDVEARFVGVSDKWRKDYGLVDSDLLGASLYEVMPEAARRWHGLFDACMRDNQAMESRDTFMRRDGRHQQLQWTLKPWLTDNGTMGGVVLTTDIVSDPEEQLEKARLQNAALRSALNPMGLIDFQGRLSFGNESLAELLGFPNANGLVGLRVMSVLADRGKMRASLKSLEATDQWIDIVEILRTDGVRRVAQISANVVRDDRGDPIGIMASCVDLTEQKKTERALNESRRQLVSLMNNLPGGFAFRCRNDLFWTMEIVSRGCQEVLGYTPDSLIDNLDVDFSSLIYPDDEAHVRSEILQAVKQHEPFQVNYRVIARDGQVKHVIQQGTPIYDRDGDIEALEGVVIDLTERVEANRDLQVEKDRAEQYLDVASSIILALDLQGRVSRFNRKGTLVSGYTESELSGLNWLDVMVLPEQVPEVSSLVSRLVSGEQSLGYLEIDIRAKDGETHLVGWELAPTRDVHGNITGVLASGEDLTTQRDIERQLLQAQKMQAVGELTGGMAHDFNNLLMAVQGNLEFLRELVAGRADAEKYVETALRAVGRGSDLTQRLLSFSRKQLLKPEPTEINRLIRDMTELLERSLGTSVTVETDLAADVGIAMVDSAMLENALLNLSINARDSMPGGGSVRIESANEMIERGYDGQAVVLKPGHYVMIAVHDTGTGMTPETIERIFEPFYSTKESGKGTGLGLPMVYGFVKQSGGHVDVKSEIGKGTSVYLYLPCLQPDAKQADAPLQAEVTEKQSGKETILVVEDDPPVRDVLVRILRGQGYQVKEAENGAAAKQMIREGLKVDMLVTDIVQPQGHNGIELADDTVLYDPDCAILLMSGFKDDVYDLADDQTLPYPLLTKPFGQQELAEKVRSILEDRVATNIKGSGRL